LCAHCGGRQRMLRGGIAMRVVAASASSGRRSLSCNVQSRTSSTSSTAETRTRPRNRSLRRSRYVCTSGSIPSVQHSLTLLKGSVQHFARPRLAAFCLPRVEAVCRRPRMATVHPHWAEYGVYVPCMGGDVKVRSGRLYWCAPLRIPSLVDF
jgi:hypothetical protein